MIQLVSGTYRTNNSVANDSNTGLFRDENGTLFVTQNIRGNYVTTKINESDYNKWFNYFIENIIFVYDDNDICNPEKAETIVAFDGEDFETEHLFWDGEKFFIQYISATYSACKVVSAEEAKAWATNYKDDYLNDCSDFINSVNDEIDSLAN